MNRKYAENKPEEIFFDELPCFFDGKGNEVPIQTFRKRKPDEISFTQRIIARFKW
jgi:hypothetical protein